MSLKSVYCSNLYYSKVAHFNHGINIEGFNGIDLLTNKNPYFYV